MAFHVGQKVVCVKNGVWASRENGDNFDKTALPQKGGVYTVRNIEDYGAATWLSFQETNPTHGFDSVCFRPVRKTDISIFTSMLTKPPAKIKRVRA